MNHTSRTVILATSAFLTFSNPAKANDHLNVLASIKPIHSLVSMVMGDLGTPEVLVKGAASPHTYSLTPSQAQDLQNADLIFWVGPDLEGFLQKPLATIGETAKRVQLTKISGLDQLEFREGGAFEGHGHDDHDEDGHDDHDEDGHDDDHRHGAHSLDPHIWLSPKNTKVMLAHIAHMLGDLDPGNAATYDANADAAALAVDDLASEIKTALAPYGQEGFLLFHDAYQYFENEFGLNASGAIAINPEVMPGAKRIAEIRELIARSDIKCVFSEPQFESKIVNVVIEGTGKKSVVIDPLGASLEPGKDLYRQLMMAMKTSFQQCLE
ncbi:zinc ABC transporter substrate-binding protein [Alphaproteobacteria bacterium]|nr:zinc ABC transporter substrate-binding protein [Alphaproteobacteria bacterium]